MDIDYQKEAWRESLFDICASPKICCKGTFCSECLFGENASKITNGSCCGYCCVYCLLSPFLSCGLIHMRVRAKMRAKYGLQEEPSDIVAACLLSPCGVCQEAREIISREKMPGKKVQTNQPSKGMITADDSEVASSTNSSQ